VLLRNGQDHAEPKAGRKHELGRVGPLETNVGVWTIFLTSNKTKMDHHQGWLSLGASASRSWLSSSLEDALVHNDSARSRVKA